MSKLLLVEDDQSIVSSLSDYLGNEGFKIENAPGQKEAIEKLDSDQYDIALVDIQLSNGNGFSVCSAIKERGTMPVIFLTASDDEYSVVAGLDMGADDYISKPFRPRELLSRINSVLRITKNTQNIISYLDLVVDTNQATVSKNGKEILLSAMEYKLLLVFLRNKGIVLSRRRLLELLWDTTGEFINDNTLTVYMKRLRDKIETNPQEPEIIITFVGLAIRWVDMDFIRNKEVKRQIVVSSILILFWGGIGIIVDSKAVWIVLSAIISSSAVSLFFTYQRYKKIADFVCILIGCYMEMKKFLLGSFKKVSYLFYMMKYPR